MMTGTIQNEMPVKIQPEGISKGSGAKKSTSDRFQDMMAEVSQNSQTGSADETKMDGVKEKTEDVSPEKQETVEADKKADDKNSLKPGEIVMLADIQPLEVPVAVLAEGQNVVSEQADLQISTDQAVKPLEQATIPARQETVLAEQVTVPAEQVTVPTGYEDVKTVESLTDQQNLSPVTDTVHTQTAKVTPEQSQMVIASDKMQKNQEPVVNQTSIPMETVVSEKAAGSQVLQANQTVSLNAMNRMADETNHMAGLLKDAVKTDAVKLAPDQIQTLGSEKEAVTQTAVLEAGDQKSETADNKNLEQLAGGTVQNQSQDGDTVRIKVAEPFHRVSQEMTEQLGNKISQKISDGVKEFDIQLTPEHLGKISIKISILETGVKVLLNCENQKTLGLLSERAEAIGQIVERNTGGPAVVEIKEENYWNQQKNATDQHANQNQGQDSDRNSGKNQHSSQTEAEDFMHQLRLGLYDEKLVI